MLMVSNLVMLFAWYGHLKTLSARQVALREHRCRVASQGQGNVSQRRAEFESPGMDGAARRRPDHCVLRGEVGQFKEVRNLSEGSKETLQVMRRNPLRSTSGRLAYCSADPLECLDQIPDVQIVQGDSPVAATEYETPRGGRKWECSTPAWLEPGVFLEQAQPALVVEEAAIALREDR
jgi:hypothetical protein